MIYITGDTHGDISWSKLNSANFPDGKGLTRDDYVIILGDFGGIWDGARQDKYIQNWYENKPWTTLFIDGNHENHDFLNSYPTEIWHNGKIHRISPHIIHLMRGQVYDIEGKAFFVMGGANSIDKYLRKEGISWWAKEMPSDEEYEEGFHNLRAHDDKVDYVLAHCAPDAIQDMIESSYVHNRLTNYLNIICQSIEFSEFYCGHYHIDKDFGKYHIRFNKVERIL